MRESDNTMCDSAKQVLVAGFYGFGNTGDEAILAAILADLREKYPGVECTVVSANPEETKRVHDVRAVNWARLHEILAAVKDADLVILGGGGLFHDYWGIPLEDILLPEHIERSMQNGYTGLALYAGLIGKPLMLYAVGVGPLLTAYGRKATRMVGRIAQVITTRDQPSADLLVEIGVSQEKIRVTADPAFALPPNKVLASTYWEHIASGKGPRLVINLRPWDFAGPAIRWVQQVALALQQFHEKFGGTFVFVPFHTQDLDVGHMLQSALSDLSKLHILPPIANPAVISGILSQADLVLGMRYHSAVFAIRGCVPLLVLAYDPKVAHVMQQVHLDEFVVPLEGADREAIARKLEAAWTRRAEWRNTLAERALALEALAHQNAEVAVRLLKRGKTAHIKVEPEFLHTLTSRLAWELAQRSTYFEVTLQRLRTDYAQLMQQKRELEAREAELIDHLHALRVELDAIKQSRGWKIVEGLWRCRLKLFPPGSIQFTLARSILDVAVGVYQRVRRFPKQIRQLVTSFLRRHVPQRVKHVYHEFVDERTFPDRHRVILFTRDDVLSSYQPQEDLGTVSEGTRVPVSLITTVLNEEENVAEWMRSLLNQTLYPDEVVIVDGGSSDRTLDLLAEMSKDAPFEVNIIEAPGTTIAQGRNIAIAAARHEIVACTDLGGILAPHWLHDLMYPFTVHPEIDVSCGFYEALVRTDRERILADFFVPQLEQVDPQSFLPSGRSMAMRKQVWAKVGGYPEWLTDAGEDTLFDIVLRSQPSVWAFVPSAIVYWHAPRTLRQLWRTVYRYARGDGETGLLSALYLTKLKKVLRYGGGLALLLVGGLGVGLLWGIKAVGLLAAFLLGTIAWGIWKDARKSDGGFSGKLYRLAATQVFILAQLIGFISGVRNRPRVRERQTTMFRRTLETILDTHKDRKGVVIYPPTHDWGFMFQRPQQMMRAFARAGYLVFYMTNNERVDAVVGFHEVEERLYLTHVPWSVLTTIESPILYIGSPWHSRVPEHFSRPVVIYDHYDDLDVSSARLEDHQKLLSSAQVVVTTSERLYNRVREQRPDVVFAPNAVDYEFIARMRPAPTTPPPVDLEEILAAARPIIGYSGALAEWFDYQLLGDVARMRLELSFVLLGVDYDGTLHHSGILQIPNVYWLGLKRYEELFNYVWRFDVAIIPFKVNEITLATSPIKLFEYMACEKPVVTTPLPECEKVEEVLIASDAKTFSKKLDRALELALDPAFRSRLRRRAQMHTWDERVRRILSALEKLA